MSTPKVGKLVTMNLPQVIHYCETHDPDEIIKLSDPDYCRDELGLGWPFFKSPATIDRDGDHQRYWVSVHRVLDHEVRVTSQWFAKHLPRFVHYLVAKGLTPAGLDQEAIDDQLSKLTEPKPAGKKSPGGARYRMHAIGNAQNSAVRYILGNIGEESFTETDWLAVKADFGHRCAYCSGSRQLVMDHAVPISIDSLGEHRLGNLVPACASCNSAQHKGQQRYDDYLRTHRDAADATARIATIEAHMSLHGYEPVSQQLSDAQAHEVREVLSLARQQIAAIALESVQSINALVSSEG